MTTTATALIGIACSILGAVLGYFGFMRNMKKDCAEEGKSSGAILTELGYIKSNTEELKRKLDKQDDRHIEFVGRVTAVEASTKQAHKRIDTIESRLNHDKDND